ncbi:nucleotidyltransferase domain-containing protein [Halobacillus kuroshimensis]|uniref:Nucleotidyltransferase domain-containing protein n=1 Tax=Halobacillus kuroshimensis TaxID=302481 RepID=A0ABS3DX79_9BACI|nr:nucleotidyltransferase domain-containing protein [Halobacillus kuroshimensis]MBN8235934.1 nucleotidyltransferase domain-containing protein [Halobacillus kuroshimensis]
MRQGEAVEVLLESLKGDSLVKAVFLKGSMGRGEEDVHSDVDLYVLVDEEEQHAFLKKRRTHLLCYQPLLFYDEIFIIAPQVIAVYDNLLHVDLFTVTEETLIHKDYIRVLYDPEGRMEKHQQEQQLYLDEHDFQDAVDDVTFFLLQYKKASDRGNDMWACKVLNDLALNAAKVLLQHYAPDRAQLGLKTADQSLPAGVKKKLQKVYQHLSLREHPTAVNVLIHLIEEESVWLQKVWKGKNDTLPFLERMIFELKNQHPV